MPIHPAFLWATRDFDGLLAALRERVEHRLVTETPDPDGSGLSIFCYTRVAQYDSVWDEVTTIARGLVLDTRMCGIMALPFPKFFNYGEQSLAVPDEPFEAFEKVDGTLGILFAGRQRWEMVTKRSWTSPQIQWAMTWLESRRAAMMDVLDSRLTYLVEIIYPDNQIVVRYPEEGAGLVLLGAYDRTSGEEIPLGALSQPVHTYFLRTPKRRQFNSLQDAVQVATGLGGDQEGFVVRFASGYRVKIKGAEYRRLHKLLSQITPLGLYDIWAAGGDLAEVGQRLPPCLFPDFDAIHKALQASLTALVQTINQAAAPLHALSDKEVGLRLAELDPLVRRFIFFARRGPGWDGRADAHEKLLRAIRPANNVLVGYAPSEHLREVQAESE